MSNPEDQNEASATKNSEVEDTSAPVEEISGELIQETNDDSASSDEIDVESAESETGSETVISIESLQAELENASLEVLKLKDVALRAEAEMQNVRRRASKDLENAHKYGLERLVQNLLPVVDSLEKAVESAEQAADEEANKAIVSGVGLCHKMLLDVLAKDGVSVVDPVGEPFDPNLHQAMSMVENPEVEPNSVVAVVQKGYTLNDRLVRPAMVMVSKGVTAPTDEEA